MLAPTDGDDRRLAFPLREGTRQLGTLLLPRDAPEATLRRVQERIAPPLEALLAAALERDELLTDVVETRALRRSDVVKTALLRAVSHDLRSPLTAILAAAEPLAAEHIDDADRRELADDVRTEAQPPVAPDRPAARPLAAGGRRRRPAPGLVLGGGDRPDARSRTSTPTTEAFRVTVRDGHAADPRRRRAARARVRERARELAAPLGRAPGPGARRRPATTACIVRIVDRGPGIPAAQVERVFEPFYRSGTEDTGHRGSGLGLAIARGFVEANGGRIWVESLPGQATAFVIELPLEKAAPVPVAT